ncbi:MAG TPA: PilN domain-containing protein [Stellaceae bacterium]|nr:PilN domain-containing protein [Stellaceae bacterium]
MSRQLTDTVRLLWQWWRREIAAMVPEPVTRWLAGDPARLIVTVEHDQAVFLQEIGGRRRRVGSADLARAEPAVLRRTLSSQAADPILELPAALALRRNITLPAAAEANLAEVVSFELERHTPFRRAEAYHGFRILSRDGARQRIVIELTAVSKAIVDTAVTRLALAGLTVSVARAAGENAGIEPSPNLLPVRAAPRLSRLPRLALGISALTTVALILAAAAIPIVRAHRDAARLDAALQSARAQAAESARLQSAIDVASREQGFLARRKNETIPVSRLLDTLTKLVPDGSWLTEMQVTGSDLRIIGESPSSSAIVALLDKTPGLSDAGFRSPVTQDAHGLEQFDIGARLDAKAGE